MATVNIGPKGKQIFIDCYNDSSIKHQDLNKVINKKLIEEGILDPDGDKLTAAYVRELYEEVLGMKYMNRPKGARAKIEISFGEEVETDSLVETDEGQNTSTDDPDDDDIDVIDDTTETQYQSKYNF